MVRETTTIAFLPSVGAVIGSAAVSNALVPDHQTACSQRHTLRLIVERIVRVNSNEVLKNQKTRKKDVKTRREQDVQHKCLPPAVLEPVTPNHHANKKRLCQLAKHAIGSSSRRMVI